MLTDNPYGFASSSFKHADPAPCRDRRRAKVHRGDRVELDGREWRVAAVEPERSRVMLQDGGEFRVVDPAKCLIVA